MPRRNLVFANNEIYHVFNRSVANQDIFITKRNCIRAIELINYYRFKQSLSYSKFMKLSVEARKNYNNLYIIQSPLIEIYAYAIMPDHFHFLIKQMQQDGLKRFVTNFQISYSKYFNKRNDRHGSLLQNPFKARWVDDDKYLLHLSRYIHLNPVTSMIVESDDINKYPWTSYSSYTGNKKGGFVNTDFILKLAGSVKIYQKFLKNRVDYQRKLKLIRKYMFDK